MDSIRESRKYLTKGRQNRDVLGGKSGFGGPANATSLTERRSFVIVSNSILRDIDFQKSRSLLLAFPVVFFLVLPPSLSLLLLLPLSCATFEHPLNSTATQAVEAAVRTRVRGERSGGKE